MVQPRQSDPRMSAEDFMRWYDLQPEGKRWELLEGHVYEMQSERLAHAETKQRIVERLRRHISALGLPCQALGDGMAVKVDDDVIFEPDVQVRCGQPLPGNTTLILDPMIVVEVASPSTQRIDALVKYTLYFRNPNIIHYLIVIPPDKAVIHHQRLASGEIVGRNYRGGIIRFDPPGIELNLDEVLT